MATKRGIVVTYCEKLYPQSYATLWTCGHMNLCDKLKPSPLPQGRWPPNTAELLHKMRSFPPYSLKTLWLRDLGRSRDKYIQCISTTIRPLVIKLDRVVSYYKGCLPEKSDNPLNKLSVEITWQIENVLSPLP